MKATGIIVPVCVLLAAGLGIGVFMEHQVCRKLDAENGVLRSKLNQMAGLTAENERLSKLLAQAKTPHLGGTAGTNGVTDERLEELARLRKQVADFQQQSNEVANLRADTRATSAELEEAARTQRDNRLASYHISADPNALTVLEADYGTAHTNLDVSDALNGRIRGGSLKAIVGNRLGGDPDFGQVKNLTVVYRFGGMVFTNQFREGDIIVLPPATSSDSP